MKTKYKEYSNIRKQLQTEGKLPNWYCTAGYQLIVDKNYIDKEETVLQRYTSIANTLSKHLPEELQKQYSKIFFDLLWSGKLSCSTPVFTNVGKNNKGLSISCSGTFILDSVDSFYKSAHEIAMMCKNGFGTSAYLGEIRPRGSSISTGGISDGVVPVMELLFNTAAHISQGNTRRGSIATYLPINHDDFWEVCYWVENNSDGCNIGWTISDKDIELMDNGDREMLKRWEQVMYLRLLGKGYLVMIDKVNRDSPKVYKDTNIKVSASNLCSEITLHSSNKYSFTCCLGSLNLANWDNISDLDIYNSIIFLDCVNSDFILNSKGIEGLQKSRNFAKWSRPLGLGVLGFSTYLQKKEIPFDSLQANFINHKIFKTIRRVSESANSMLAKQLGEPELMKDTGLRCSHLLAIAPTLSTALIMGGVSHGIEPFFSNIYTQETSAGEIRRANPVLVSVLKKYDRWNKNVIDEIIRDKGSVQNLSFLTEEHKSIFKTAFEVDQMSIIRMADLRQKYIDQSQSLNLFFSTDADEYYISQVHKEAIKSKYIKSLYYIRSSGGVNARVPNSQCESCE